jgi:hypothetical protein
MSEHALGRANQVRTPRLLGGQTDDDGRRVGQRDPRRNGRPASEWRALQAEQAEQTEDATEEAFDARALAQLLGGPGGRYTGAILLPLRIPGDDGHCPEHGVDRGDQAPAPAARIQAHDARTHAVEAHRPGAQPRRAAAGQRGRRGRWRGPGRRAGAGRSRGRAAYGRDSPAGAPARGGAKHARAPHPGRGAARPRGGAIEDEVTPTDEAPMER